MRAASVVAFLASIPLLASPALAHKLKVFATVEGHTVSGYAFFIGGGRPDGGAWTARDAAGRILGQGTTDQEGRFAFDLPASASDITVTVDAHDAHVASATLGAERVAHPPNVPATAEPDPAGERLPAQVEAAVQRQVAPLLERIEQMDARLRYVDMLSGVFLIAGLAGMLMWARGRRG